MQVQSIANTKSDINFKSATAIDKATAFVNMDDHQLRMISYVSGRDKKQEKKNRHSLLRTFYAIPIVDTIASAVLVKKSSKLSDEAIAALRKTKLSTRLAHAAGTAGFWAISLSAIELFTIAKKSVQRNSPGMKKFDRENPVTSLLTDLTAILAGGTLALIGLDKLANKSLKKHPERADEAERTITQTRRLINESKFSKETLPRLVEEVTKFAQKHPTLAKTGRFALANSVWILFGVGFLKMVGQAKNDRDRVETNYKNIKQTQLNVAKRLVNDLNHEKRLLTEELEAQAEEKRLAEKEVEEVKNHHCEDCEECNNAEDTDIVEDRTETESVEE